MMITDRVVVSAIEPEDIPIIVRWRNAPEIYAGFVEYEPLNTVGQRMLLERLAQDPRPHLELVVAFVAPAVLREDLVAGMQPDGEGHRRRRPPFLVDGTFAGGVPFHIMMKLMDGDLREESPQVARLFQGVPTAACLAEEAAIVQIGGSVGRRLY